MKRRQTSVPQQWLITDERSGAELFNLIRRLPSGSGVLVRHHHLPPGKRASLLRRIRRLGGPRQLQVVDETRRIARVHDAREIRRARLCGAELLLLSPLFATRSHPGWRPLPRMRAAALVRLAKTPVIALGGMDERRFKSVRKLGFAGWAAIDAWLKFPKVTR